MLKKTHTSQSGQVAVIVLLIMVVLLTIGLSLATRTTQELFLSDQQAESSRVFNAAESGIEQALSNVQAGTSGTLSVDNVDVSYSVQESNVLQTRVAEGMSVHINLTGYTGDVTFEWAEEGSCGSRASLIAVLFYADAGEIKSKSVPFGPACDSRSDSFADGILLGGSPYYHRYTLSTTYPSTQVNHIPAGTLFMRVKPVYADTDLFVSGGLNFPTQHHTISSTATYVGGDEERSIQVSRTLPAGPSYMDYALYSGGAITQNP